MSALASSLSARASDALRCGDCDSTAMTRPVFLSTLYSVDGEIFERARTRRPIMTPPTMRPQARSAPTVAPAMSATGMLETYENHA